jgi:hypothetical protein
MAQERADKVGRLSAEEVAELSRKRAESMGALSAEERDEMQRRRARLMPGAGDAANG